MYKMSAYSSHANNFYRCYASDVVKSINIQKIQAKYQFFKRLQINQQKKCRLFWKMLKKTRDIKIRVWTQQKIKKSKSLGGFKKA